MIESQTALIYTMVLVSAADSEMSDAELARMGEIVRQLPVFSGFDADQLSDVAQECAEILGEDDGLDKALAQIRDNLPDHLRETAYVLACDIAVADLRASQEELRLLEMLRYSLDLDRLHAAGAAMTVTSRSAGPAEELAGEGMTAAATAREVTEKSDTVIVMVTDTGAVDKVLHGENGVIAGLSAGKSVIDMSTTKVRETREWAEEVKAAGAHYIDAPVSGGTVGAEAGELTIMVGADDDAIADAMPIFETLGRNITHIGGIGAGQVTKTANQAIVGMTLAAVAEGLTLADRAGVDPGKVRTALLGGFAESRVLDLHGGRMVEREFEPGGRASVHHKDILQALELAEQVGLDLVSTRTNLQLWQKMLDRGWQDLDQAGIIRAVEEE